MSARRMEAEPVHGLYYALDAWSAADTVCKPDAGISSEDWDKVTCRDCIRIKVERTGK